MKIPTHIRKYSKRTFSNRVSLVLTVLAFGLIGSYLLYRSFAAGPFASLEAESGAISGSAIFGNDTNASGTNPNGNYILFRSSQGDVTYNDDKAVYTGTWTVAPNDPAKYNGDDHYSQTTGSDATFTFSGTSVTLYGTKASHHGIAGISIDNGVETNVDYYAATRADNVEIYRSPGLNAGSHSIKIRVTGNKNAASTGIVITIDRFVVGGDTGPPIVPPPPPVGGDPINNTDGLHVGYLFTSYSFDQPGGATGNAYNAIVNEVKTEPWVMATHIYGFGVWSVVPNWTDLDGRVNVIRSMNGIPVIVLCCSPPAMSTDASNIESSPRDDAFDAYAAMSAQIAQRYPDVKYFVVWNEMKGFWNNAANRWDYERYTRFYNKVYAAVKQARPDAQLGGPYPPLTNWSPVPGGAGSTVSGIWGTTDGRGLEAIQYWLDNKAGGEFVTMDGGCTLHSQQGGGYAPGATVITANECFKAIAEWVRARTSLPIWWIEFYANPVNSTDENYKRDVFIDAFNKYKAGGGNVALFWGSECYPGALAYLFGGMWNCSNGSMYPLYYALKNGYN